MKLTQIEESNWNRSKYSLAKCIRRHPLNQQRAFWRVIVVVQVRRVHLLLLADGRWTLREIMLRSRVRNEPTEEAWSAAPRNDPTKKRWTIT